MWQKKLSTLLNLEEVGQDWGIINSDSKRLEEFIDFYKSNITDDKWENEALAELIFESANDSILEKTFTVELKEKLKRFVRENKDDFPFNFEYWSKLDKDFPVTKYIN